MELARALLRAAAAAAAARLGVARLEGDYSARPADPLFASADALNRAGFIGGHSA